MDRWTQIEIEVAPITEKWDHVVENVHSKEDWDQLEDWEELIGLKWLDNETALIEEEEPEDFEITEVQLDDMDDLPWLLIEEPEVEPELDQEDEGEIEAIEEQQKIFKARNHMRGQKQYGNRKQNGGTKHGNGWRQGKKEGRREHNDHEAKREERQGRKQFRNKFNKNAENKPRMNKAKRDVQRMKAEAKLALDKLHFQPQAVSDLNLLVLGDFDMKPMDFLSEPQFERTENSRRLHDHRGGHRQNKRHWNKGYGHGYHKAFA
jgi:hypothetical protein